MAAIIEVGVGAMVEGTHDTALTPALPTGTQGQDHLEATIISELTGTTPPTITTPAGWTHIATASRDSHHLFTYWKLAAGTAGAATTDGNPTFSTGSTLNIWAAFVSAKRGVDTTTPLGPGAVVSVTTTTAATSPSGSVTTTVADALVRQHVASNADNNLALVVGSEEGFTAQAGGDAYSTPTSNALSAGLADKVVTVSGTAQTLPTWGKTLNDTAGTWAMVAYEVLPDPGIVTEVQEMVPDAILAVSNLTGTVSAIQDDPDAPDANWLTA